MRCLERRELLQLVGGRLVELGIRPVHQDVARRTILDEDEMRHGVDHRLEKLLVGKTGAVDAADFHHQLHHRFFECNYGTVDAPWDKWFGTDHDGSDEATARARKRRSGATQ